MLKNIIGTVIGAIIFAIVGVVIQRYSNRLKLMLVYCLHSLSKH